MFYKKQGAPEESDLVQCTITKIQYHSVFARLDEFENKSGMIHISEISPGRIRNIYDFVKEGKVVICKVLKIHPKLGHIDLSLRRVSEGQRRMKSEELKQEQLAEKIIELLAPKYKKKPKELYDEIAKPILTEYKYVHDCFLESIQDKKILEKHVKKDYIEELHKLIVLRNKPKEIFIKENIKLTTYEDKGIEIIKETLNKVLSHSDKITIKYHGGGIYDLSVTDIDFKVAEKTLKEANTMLEKEFSNNPNREIAITRN